MAIIREARTTNNIDSSYEVPKQDVNFPWVMMFACILIDIIDIILYFTAVGAIPWWFFTTIIFTPILIIYINSREKKFSPGSIKTDIERRNNFSTARDSARLTRESQALSKAGKTVAALEKAEAAAKATSKLPQAFKWMGIIAENIPLIEFAPINSIMLFVSYLDNKNSVQQTQDSMVEMTSKPEIKIVPFSATSTKTSEQPRKAA